MYVKQIQLFDENAYLSSTGALFRPNNATLYTADLHLSKDAHFRKEGIPVPMESTMADLKLLDETLTFFSASRCVFLGDLFHSSANEQIWEIIEWGKQHSDIQFELIRGNHDYPDLDWLQKFGFHSSSTYSIDDGWKLIHDYSDDKLSEIPRLSGHIHPKIALKGKGRQRITLPCFWKKENDFILPSFGSFTGGQIVKPERNHQIFALSSTEIFELNF